MRPDSGIWIPDEYSGAFVPPLPTIRSGALAGRVFAEVNVRFLGLVLLLLLPLPSAAQDTPRAEFFGGYSFLHTFDQPNSVENLQGWNGALQINFNQRFSLVADFSGHYGDVLLGPAPQIPLETDVHTYLFGPRVSWRSERTTAFAHVLVGGSRYASDFAGFDLDSNVFAAAFGGGLDIGLSQRVAVRALQADYLLHRVNGVNLNNVRISAGVVFRFGSTD